MSSSHPYFRNSNNNFSKTDEVKEDKNSIQIIKGTVKVDKVHYIMHKEDKKLFEDINLEYIEPLEGTEESANNNDIAYKKYLKGVNKQYNLKEEEITFTNDLGLKNNILNVKEIFEKIKKNNKYKSITANSFRTNKNINRNKIKHYDNNIIDIEENMYEDYFNEKDFQKSKKLNIKSISKYLLSKIDIQKYLNNEKRIMTYENINKVDCINKYFTGHEILLDTNEKKKTIRRINSDRKRIDIIEKMIENEDSNEFHSSQFYDKEKEDIFGNKKRSIIQDPGFLFDEEEMPNDSIMGRLNRKKEEIRDEVMHKEEKEEEKKVEENKVKEEEYIHPLIKLEEDIKKINMKRKKKKKKSPEEEQQQKKQPKEKKKTSNYIFSIKKDRDKKLINKYKDPKPIKYVRSKSRLKSPAINSILNDISALCQLILSDNKKKARKNRDIYHRHFGYEYWKENEFRQRLLYPLTTQKRGLFTGGKSINSTIINEENNSMFSSNFSWLFKNNNKFYDIYNDNFSTRLIEERLNPYSVNWTKNMLKQAYNRTIKLKKKISGVPKIELLPRSRSSLCSFRPKISSNIKQIIHRNNNIASNKSNNLFGRIYNNNEVEFPFIYKP